MRYALAVLLLYPVGATPALANGQMKQSPLLGHKAGAACAPGHPRTQGGGSSYRMGGCLRSRQ